MFTNIFTNPLMTGHLFMAIKQYLQTCEEHPNDGSAGYSIIDGAKVEIANVLLDELSLPLGPVKE